MKMKLGLELIGPCSDTGVTPDPYDTIAVINENGRVSFHHFDECQIEGPGVFQGRIETGSMVPSTHCYLVYTVDAVSDVKSDIRRLRKNIRQKV